MNTRSLKGAVALGSLTATVALLAGLGTAQAQMGTGQGGTAAGRADRSGRGFLPAIVPHSGHEHLAQPVRQSADEHSRQHRQPAHQRGDASPDGRRAWFEFASARRPRRRGRNQLQPGLPRHPWRAACIGGIDELRLRDAHAVRSRRNQDRHAGRFRLARDPGQLHRRGRHRARRINPKVGAGNNSIPRIQWAYGTLGPWLFGQYNSAWADPMLFAPDIGDQNQVGPMQTVNIRRPQIRYTYLWATASRCPVRSNR